MPRFVVLAHHTTPFHYDLMLERGGVLWTWSFEEPPGRDGQACRRIQDHRLLYLDYEGEISGGRGRVERHDAGTYEGDVGEERTEVVFEGGGLKGRWVIERVSAPDRYLLHQHPLAPHGGHVVEG